MSGGRRTPRVLMYCPQFHPLEGGYERAARRTSAELARRGYAVEVVTERRSRRWPAVDRVDGVPVRRLPVAFRPGVHIASASAVLVPWLVANLRRFDLLHVHTYGGATAAALAAARLCRVPAVLKLSSVGRSGIGAVLGRGTAPAVAVRRALHRAVSACLVPSAASRDEAVAFGIPPERVHLLPNGVDTDALAPADDAARAAARAALAIEDGPLVVCVAQMRPEKGIHTLLAAWERTAPSFPGARLAYVGDGPERAALEARLAASPVAASVTLAGAGDPRPWYAAADLLVIPSDYEGLSNVLLEGMSAGLPVVATRVSGTVDAFEQAELGELAEPRDPEGLAAALARMLADPARRRACGAAARDLAVRRYSLGHVVDRLEAIYAGLFAPAEG